jgi:protein gp37
MGTATGIAWTHHTHNPWIGCEKVSPACKHCYAEELDARYRWGGVTHWGPDAPRYRTSAKLLAEPAAWHRDALAAGERRRVFCASLADVFEDRADLEPYRHALWRTIEATPGLDWLLLTKRPENIGDMLPPRYARPMPAPRVGQVGEDPIDRAAWQPNVWLGTTVESADYTHRIDHLLRVPAVVHFLSIEPLLGRIDLHPWLEHGRSAHPHHRIGWVIVGCESGGDARPQDLDAMRDLRDQCAEYAIPFFLKQAAIERDHVDRPIPASAITRGPRSYLGGRDGRGGKVIERPLLDAVEHVAVPTPAPWEVP